MDTGNSDHAPHWSNKPNPVKRKNSVKCTLKTKSVPKGGSSSAFKLQRQPSTDRTRNMEQQNELAAIFQKRKARSEPRENNSENGTSGNEAVSHVKAAKSLFESTESNNNNVVTTAKKPTTPSSKPKNPNKVDSRKVSDIASNFHSSNNSDQGTVSMPSKTDYKSAYGRQMSDLPVKYPKPKPVTKISSSPNLVSSCPSLTIPEDEHSESSTLSHSPNVKALRENLFLSIDHNKRLSSSSLSPGSASPGPVVRSRSPTPGVTENPSTPTLRKKIPVPPPKPSQVGPSGCQNSGSSSKRSSGSSDRNEDAIGDTFVAALKAGLESSTQSKVESRTLPKPPKPDVLKKPQLAKLGQSSHSSPGSPALPPKLVKNPDTTHSTASPVLPTRTKRMPPVPNPDVANKPLVPPLCSSPPKKKTIAGRITDELSRPIPPIKPSLTAQLSNSDDYYADVEVPDFTPPEGDKDSGRGSTEGGAVDGEKRSSAGDSWSDRQDDEKEAPNVARRDKKTKRSIRHRHSGDLKKTTRRHMTPKTRFYSNPERQSSLVAYDEVAAGGESDNWVTDEDEDEGYEYVADIQPPSLQTQQQVAAPPQPLHTLERAQPSDSPPIRPPRNKHKSPTASQPLAHLGSGPKKSPANFAPNTPPRSESPQLTPPPPHKDVKPRVSPDHNSRGRCSPATVRMGDSLNRSVPPPTVPRRKSVHGDAEGPKVTAVTGESNFATFPRPAASASSSTEAPPVPPARGKNSKPPISVAPTPIPTTMLTPPSLPPRNKDSKDEPVSPTKSPRTPVPTPPLTPDTVVPLSPPVTLPRLPPKARSPSDVTESRGARSKLSRGDALDDHEMDPQDSISNKLLTQVPPPPYRPGSTTDNATVKMVMFFQTQMFYISQKSHS